MKPFLDKRGVTLMELMVVCAIVAIVTVMAVPSYNSFVLKHRINRATMALSDALQTARMKAVSENRSYTVSFDVPNNSYMVVGGTTWVGTGTGINMVWTASPAPNPGWSINNYAGYYFVDVDGNCFAITGNAGDSLTLLLVGLVKIRQGGPYSGIIIPANYYIKRATLDGSDNPNNALTNSGVVFGYNVTNRVDGTPIGAGESVLFQDYLYAALGSYSHETFAPDGTAQSHGAIYLMPAHDYIEKRYDRGRAITIDQFTGLVKTWTHDNTKNGVWQ